MYNPKLVRPIYCGSAMTYKREAYPFAPNTPLETKLNMLNLVANACNRYNWQLGVRIAREQQRRLLGSPHAYYIRLRARRKAKRSTT